MELGRYERTALLALADGASMAGECGLPLATAEYALDRLAHAGLVQRIVRRSAGGEVVVEMWQATAAGLHAARASS
jgi:hypothetical protein